MSESVSALRFEPERNYLICVDPGAEGGVGTTAYVDELERQIDGLNRAVAELTEKWIAAADRSGSWAERAREEEQKVAALTAELGSIKREVDAANAHAEWVSRQLEAVSPMGTATDVILQGGEGARSDRLKAENDELRRQLEYLTC